MVRTQVQLTARQSRELHRRAKEQGVSIAELIRRSVDKMLVSQPSGNEIRARAKRIAGIIDSGTGDLAERHDEYLAEAFDH